MRALRRRSSARLRSFWAVLSALLRVRLLRVLLLEARDIAAETTSARSSRRSTGSGMAAAIQDPVVGDGLVWALAKPFSMTHHLVETLL